MSKKQRNPKDYTQGEYGDYRKGGKRNGGYSRVKTGLSKVSKRQPDVDVRNYNTNN